MMVVPDLMFLCKKMCLAADRGGGVGTPRNWYVMMGIGQVETLRFPAEQLRDINRLVESEAWGSYRTEFHPTYDYRALYAQLQQKMK
jgi:hypothetical protein